MYSVLLLVTTRYRAEGDIIEAICKNMHVHVVDEGGQITEVWKLLQAHRKT